MPPYNILRYSRHCRARVKEKTGFFCKKFKFLPYFFTKMRISVPHRFHFFAKMIFSVSNPASSLIHPFFGIIPLIPIHTEVRAHELCQTHRRRITTDGKRKSADWFFINNLTNVKYLSGYTGSHGVLLLSHDKKYILTDGRLHGSGP